MQRLLLDTLEHLSAGLELGREEASLLARYPDPGALWGVADTLRSRLQGECFHLCSIINARSGNCSEDCSYCAQAARHQAAAACYPFIERQHAMAIARDTVRHGIARLSLVCSGRTADDETMTRMSELYQDLRRVTPARFCASTGLLDPVKASRLRAMGVERCHCNLESCRAYYPQVCTTHSYQDKVDTLTAASTAGMSLCSGGILGLGESMEQRLDLAFELRQLGVRSIPVNILTPISGTPLAGRKPPPLQEVLTTVALFRLINPRAVIRMAGGRQQYGHDQYRLFRAGANGAIAGNYLTTAGNSLAGDLREITACGFVIDHKGISHAQGD